jgi:hypothetical protein
LRATEMWRSPLLTREWSCLNLITLFNELPHLFIGWHDESHDGHHKSAYKNGQMVQ